jgi:ketosteroid isomerase-like protein
MPDEATVRRLFRRHWEYAGTDQTIAHEIYHDDAVLEFPQSGERFVGKAKFQAFREAYPARLDFRTRRISGSGDLWIAENLIRYDGADWNFTVNICWFRGEKVAKEWIYIMDGWEAPDWRAPYRETFDPLASLEADSPP